MAMRSGKGAGVSESEKMTRSAGVVGAGALASRVLGFMRDMIATALFGTGIVNEAFFVAWMIPALMRRLIGEGSLTVAFVPVFTQLRQERGEDEARRFAQSFWTLMTLVVAVLSLLCIIFARPIVWLLTNKNFQLRDNGAVYALAITMTQTVMPYLFFIGLTALAMGILNSYKKFFAPAFHPVLLNAVWLAALIVLEKMGMILVLAKWLDWKWLETPGISIIIGVLIGGVFQLALQIPFLIDVGLNFRPRLDLKHPALRRIGMLMLPSFFAVGIMQINATIATFFITAFPGGRSALYIANRVQEFPYALISLAFATVALPSLSENAAKGDHAAFSATMSYGLRVSYFLMIPASIGLGLLSHPFIQVAFQRGHWDAIDTAATANILLMECVGLFAIGALRLVIQAFYAHQDMVTPLYAAAAGMAVTGLGCWALYGPLARSGVALAISLAAIVNLAILWWRLPQRVPGFKAVGLSRAVTNSMIASLPMALWIAALNHLPLWSAPRQLPLKLAVFVAALGGGGLLFLGTARLLKAPELDPLVGAFMRRIRR
jgi:putative peptidoglycan lipid II flippase